MPSGKLPDHITSEDQPSVVGPIDRNRHRKFGTYSYKPEYCDIVFELLSRDDQCRTKAHCCAALQCAKETLLRWMANFPEFKRAMDSGLEIGAMKWRDKIREHAYEPSSTVNNGLIKLLSSNVYGIKEDPEVLIINNNTNTNLSAEEQLKKRGIPVPKLDVEDLDEQSDS